MRIIKSDSLPRLWWLNPWSTALYLHEAAFALKDYADRADRCVDIQAKIIDDQSAEIAQLRRRLEDMNDAIISGTAITPDAYPHE
jgi:hypothetical protein